MSTPEEAAPASLMAQVAVCYRNLRAVRKPRYQRRERFLPCELLLCASPNALYPKTTRPQRAPTLGPFLVLPPKKRLAIRRYKPSMISMKYWSEKYAAISTPTNVTTTAVPHSKASRQPIVLPDWSPEAPF